MHSKLTPLFIVTPNGDKIRASYLVNTMNARKAKTKIPKSLVVYFLMLEVCFGMDFGFNKMFDKKKGQLVKTLTILMSILISVISMVPFKTLYRKFWYWCTLVKYNSHFFIFNYLQIPKYKMYEFLNEVHSIVENVTEIENNVFGIGLLTYTSIIWFLRGAFMMTRCIIGQSFKCHETNLYLFSLYIFFFLSADIISGTLIIILYYVQAFISHTKKILRSELDVKKFEKRYIAIAECYEKIKPLYDYIIMVELCINTPRLMATLWYMLFLIKEDAEWYSYTGEWLSAFHLTIQMCIPAIVAEMVAYQIDAIKLILNEQRRKENDPQRSAEITRVLRYMKARRLQSAIWRVLPGDFRLPIALLSICTTYFIVILQFTHLYD